MAGGLYNTDDDSNSRRSTATRSNPNLSWQRLALTSVALTLFAVTLGHAVDLKDGTYSPEALGWLTLSIGFCLVGIISPRFPAVETLCRRMLPAILAFGIADQAIYLLMRVRSDPQITLAFATIVLLGLIQFFDMRRLRIQLMVIMVLAFFVAGELAFNLHAKDPRIDVFMFQANASWAITHGLNPYTFRYPSMYPPGTPYYGPGVVDAHGILTVGFPYPPLSLFLALPGYLLGGDVRYSHLAAMGLSAGLIVATRPGRIGALAATLLLLMPRAIYVLDLAWTEPFLVLTFSLVMFCAFRWPKALPYALGLYFSTKQYTILTIPLLPLLIEGPRHWKTLGTILFKAALVVAAINLPFLIWNAHEFFRALVLFQFLQGFRNDAPKLPGVHPPKFPRRNSPGLDITIASGGNHPPNPAPPIQLPRRLRRRRNRRPPLLLRLQQTSLLQLLLFRNRHRLLVDRGGKFAESDIRISHSLHPRLNLISCGR